MKKVKLGFYTKDDLQFLHELLSDEETRKNFPLMYTTNIEQSNLRLKNRLIEQYYRHTVRFLIKERFSGNPVGEISGRIAKDVPEIMELAVIIHPNYRGKGFAKAGTIEFMKYIRRHNKNITRLRLEIADNNSASLCVAKKLEFEFTKQKSEHMKYFEKDVR